MNSISPGDACTFKTPGGRAAGCGSPTPSLAARNRLCGSAANGRVAATQPIRDKLRLAGLRPTRQRLALALLLFGGRDRHVTADLLHAETRRIGHPISLATIYNTLNLFRSAGLVRSVNAGSGKLYFDTNTSLHHHFVFEDEDVFIDIPDDLLTIECRKRLPEGLKIINVDVMIHLRNDIGLQCGPLVDCVSVDAPVPDCSGVRS